MNIHPRIVLIAAIAVLGALPGSLPATVSAAPPPTPTFNKNLLLPNSSSAAEPSIQTDQFGQSFVIGPTGVPAGCKAFRVRHDGSAAQLSRLP